MFNLRIHIVRSPFFLNRLARDKTTGKNRKGNVHPGRALVASFAATAGERIAPSTLTPYPPLGRKWVGGFLLRCYRYLTTLLYLFLTKVKSLKKSHWWQPGNAIRPLRYALCAML